jgi:uncharacterized protein YlxW (UPF0749 family)
MNDASAHSSPAPTSPSSAASTPTPATSSRLSAKARPATRRRASWILTLSGVCFVFGGLLAVQLRAIERVRENQRQDQAGVELAQQQTERIRAQIQAEKKRASAMEVQNKALLAKLATTGSLSAVQMKKLNSQMKEMRALAGLTEVAGPGVRMTINDNPRAKEFVDPSGFGPGTVHDFDLQMIVNELRAAKAEAISVNGIRVTGYTPIRCVGPVIYINFQTVAPPFIVETIGDQKTLEGALKMPGGVVDNLRNPDAGLPLLIEIERADTLKLAASENLPRFTNAKAP